MKTLEQTLPWYRSRFEFSLDVLRIYLGLGLMIRGMLYIGSAGRNILFQQINDIGFSWAIPYMVGHYVILAHTVGGLLLMLGLLTRAMALIQIPILLGAVVFVHAQQSFLLHGQDLEFSILVLVLLAVVAWCGPGRLSMDVSTFGRVKGEQRAA